jgi:hypothetical protein
MLPLEKIITTLEGGEDFAIPFIARLIELRGDTLNARLRRRKTPLAERGKPNRITRETALQLVHAHRSAILGWTTKKEIAKKHNTTPQAVDYLMRKHDLRHETDLTKNNRLSPEAEGRLEEALVTYTAGHTMTLNGKRYVSAIRTTEDACKKARKQRNESPKKLFKRLYGRLHERITLGLYECIRTEGKINLYVSEQDYSRFVQEVLDSPGRLRKKNRRKSSKEKTPQRKTIHYDPDNPPSISECRKGAKFVYDNHYTGRIAELIEDPYRPMIKVHYTMEVDESNNHIYSVKKGAAPSTVNKQ